MNNPGFKQRSLTDTLTLLCQAKGGELLRKGKVNQSAVARLAGTKQGNISRWYSGLANPTDENVRLLATAFKITPAQMRGEVSISFLDGLISKEKGDDQFIYEYEALPEEEKYAVREFVRYRKYLADQKGE